MSEPTTNAEPKTDTKPVPAGPDQIKACLVIYDIPQGSELANPSPKLRRRAIRVNLSCWIVREDLVPYSLLNELAEGGAVYHVVKFDASEGKNLIKMAIQALKKEVAEHVQRGEESMQSAAERHLGNEDITPEERQARFELRAGAIVARLEELLEDVKEAAKQFGIDPKRLSLTQARATIAALDAGYQTRAAEYAKAQKKLAGRSGTGAALAEAAAADNLPAGVAADYLDDTASTAEEGGESLREVFAGVAGHGV